MLAEANIAPSWRSASASRRGRLSADAITQVVLRVGDGFVVLSSGILAAIGRFGFTPPDDQVVAALAIGLLASINLFPLLGTYSSDRLRSPARLLTRLLFAWLLTIACVLTILFVMKSSGELSRLWVALWLVTGIVMLIAWRLAAIRWTAVARQRGQLARRLILVGDAESIERCLAQLPAGSSDNRVDAVLPLDGQSMLQRGVRRLGDTDGLLGELQGGRCDRVVLTLQPQDFPRVGGLVRLLRRFPVEVMLFCPALSLDTPARGVTHLGNVPCIMLLGRPIDGGKAVVKSLLDRGLAAALLTLLGPLMLLIAAAVRLTSPGPALFRQPRIGFHQETIEVLKFRTMYVEACDPPNAHEVRQATRGDLRVTPLGGLLRRTSLDELPQFLNVLKGDMSLVGPRPHALAHNRLFASQVDDYLAHHRVKPGLTGWAQVNGLRGEIQNVEHLRRRTELDLAYVEGWALAFDLYILMRTLAVVVGNRHAH